MNALALTPLTMDELRKRVPSAFADQPYHGMSDRYKYIRTAEAIEGIMLAGLVPYQAVQSTSRTAGKQAFTKHMIRFGYPDAMKGIQVGDSIAQVAMINSHDGSSPYEFESALYKLLCMNGLMAAGKDFEKVKVYHKGNDIINRVVEGSFRVIEQSQKALSVSKEWSQIELNPTEQLLLATGAHSLRFADSEGEITTPILPPQLLAARRREDGAPITDGQYRLAAPYGFAKTDLWTTFNVIQENVIKGGLHGVRNTLQSGRRRHVTTRPVNGIDQDTRLNRALWTLTERMAELKAA